MVDFLTYDDLLSIKKDLNESIILRSAKGFAGKNVFLSYSSEDSDLVVSAIQVLQGHGGAVYLDRGDMSLPQTPSPETARILRDAIGFTRKLVVFVSTHSKNSRWVPWELGVGDGLKGSRSVSLFPVADFKHEQAWAEVEYLGLYRRIVWGRFEGKSKSEWLVWDHHTNIAEPLAAWISDR